MNKLDALKELAAKVEAGTARPSEVFDGFDTPCQDFALQQRAEDAKNAYRGSLDAAKALHEAVLPGWEYGMDSAAMVWVKLPGMRASYRHKHGDNPARAWLLAILRALIAQEESA